MNREERKNNQKLPRALLAACLALMFAVNLASCASNAGESSAGRSYLIYYLNRDQDQVQSERFTPIDTATDALIMELVALQQQLPDDADRMPLLPEGTTIVDYELADGTLTLDLDASYAALAPSREILTRAGLVRTFVQVDGVSRVAFRAGGEPLTDLSGNEVGTLTAGSFLENAGKEINAYQRTTLLLYFSDESGTALVPERHTVYYTSNEPLERVVMEELMRGPSEAGHTAVISSTANVLSATSQDQICYINFESSPANALITAGEEVQVYAIVNSLTENCNVDRVQISIGGESSGVFLETVSLDQYFERNTALIQGG